MPPCLSEDIVPRISPLVYTRYHKLFCVVQGATAHRTKGFRALQLCSVAFSLSCCCVVWDVASRAVLTHSVYFQGFGGARCVFRTCVVASVSRRTKRTHVFDCALLVSTSSSSFVHLRKNRAHEKNKTLRERPYFAPPKTAHEKKQGCMRNSRGGHRDRTTRPRKNLMHRSCARSCARSGGVLWGSGRGGDRGGFL